MKKEKSRNIKSDIKDNDNKSCTCSEFEFLLEPDDTGAIISHKKCKKLEFISIEDLGEFKKMFPDTKIAIHEEESKITEEELWNQLLKELPAICMYAPMHEPERQNFIMSKLKSKYNITPVQAS